MKKISIIFTLICFHLSFAQGELRFKRLSIGQGLSQSTVETIIQDQAGFLWIGTEDGLNRYDGYAFKIFKHDPEDSTSISNNNVWCLYEDHNGYLWIGTFSDGLDRYDPKTETFKRFLHNPAVPSALNSNNVRSICEDKLGYLWIGTRDRGVNRFNLNTLQFENQTLNPEVQKTLVETIIRDIYPDSENNLWIATNKGLFIYNQSTAEFSQLKSENNISANLSDQSIRHIYEDRSGIFWISTLNGLNSYNPDTKKITQYLHDEKNPESISATNINEVCEDEKGRLWIAAHKDGLIIFDRSDGSFKSYSHDELNPNSVSSNSLRQIYRDRGGLIWIGTLGGGLNMFDPGTERFHQYRSIKDNPNSLSHSIIWSILESSDGDLWFATHNGGLNRFKRKTGKYSHFKYNAADPVSISSNNLRFVMQDRRGKIWIATQDAGINCLDQYQQKFTRFRHDSDHPGSISSNNVRTIYEDHSGNLWVGTWGGGLDLFDPDTDRFVHFINQPANPNSLSSNNVISIYQDSEGVYWVATTDGLNRLSFSSTSLPEIRSGSAAQTITRFFHKATDPNSLSNNYVLSIHEAKNGDLWFGTMLGLNRLEKKDRDQPVFKRYLIKDGLPNDMIYGILEDAEGHIWCSTNNGLTHLNLNDETFNNYDMRDGLQSNEFNTGAYFKTASGSMIFGGVDGATEFFPDSLVDSPYLAPTVLTGFYIFDQAAALNRAVTGIEEITLSYKDNYFSFDFAALDFSKPERNRYAYMLEGLDPGWVNAGTRRFAGYTQLDAGEYIFKVKGTNGDGVWNEQSTAVRIIITPPFWKTWWFISLILLAAGGLIAFIIINRVKQLLAIERLRSKIAADLHDDIGAGLTEISIMGEVIAQKLTGQSRQHVNTELQKIGNTARGLIDSMSHIVWLVNPKRDSLFDLISRLGDTYTELLDSTDIQFRTENLDSLKKVRLKMEHRQQLFMIFHEAINNSVKYSLGTEITLNSSLKGKQLTLQLIDNGKGFEVEKATTGNGIKNMRERARQIGGRLSIISDVKTGTNIEFKGNIS